MEEAGAGRAAGPWAQSSGRSSVVVVGGWGGGKEACVAAEGERMSCSVNVPTAGWVPWRRVTSLLPRSVGAHVQGCLAFSFRIVLQKSWIFAGGVC